MALGCAQFESRQMVGFRSPLQRGEYLGQVALVCHAQQLVVQGHVAGFGLHSSLASLGDRLKTRYAARPIVGWHLKPVAIEQGRQGRDVVLLSALDGGKRPDRIAAPIPNIFFNIIDLPIQSYVLV